MKTGNKTATANKISSLFWIEALIFEPPNITTKLYTLIKKELSQKNNGIVKSCHSFKNFRDNFLQNFGKTVRTFGVETV